MTCSQCGKPKRWHVTQSSRSGRWICYPCKDRQSLARQQAVLADQKPPGASPCWREIRDYWATLPRKEARA